MRDAIWCSSSAIADPAWHGAVSTRSIKKSAPIVYLDQNIFVGFLRRSDSTPVVGEVMERLLALVRSGDLIVPLSASHYLETWHRARWQSRVPLAACMRELSGWRTIAPLHTLTRWELDALLPGSAVSPADRAIGIGACHAFTSPTGRYRFVESVYTPESPEGPPVEMPPEMERMRRDDPELWEWIGLAMPGVDFPAPNEENPGWDATPAHRDGDAMVERDRQVREWVLEDTRNRADLRRHLVGEDVLEILDYVNEWIDDNDLDLGPFISDPATLRDLHASLPSREVVVELKCLRHENAQFPLEQHDRTDLAALSAAFVYCDVVVTEKRWSHMAKRMGVQERFGTTVTATLSDLLELL